MEPPMAGHNLARDVVFLRNTVPNGQTRTGAPLTSNCRVILCYFFVLFSVALVWVTIVDTQQMTVIVFSAVFTAMFVASWVYYKIRRRAALVRTHARGQDDERIVYEPFDARELAILLQLRQNLETLNNLTRNVPPFTLQEGMREEDIAKLKQIIYSEDKFQNDASIHHHHHHHHYNTTTTTTVHSSPEILPVNKIDSNSNNNPQIVSSPSSSSPSIELKAISKECSVCLSTYVENDTLVILPCNHYYHKDCVTEWLRKSKTCPLCKQLVTVLRPSPSSDPVTNPHLPLPVSIPLGNHPAMDTHSIHIFPSTSEIHHQDLTAISTSNSTTVTSSDMSQIPVHNHLHSPLTSNGGEFYHTSITDNNTTSTTTNNNDNNSHQYMSLQHPDMTTTTTTPMMTSSSSITNLASLQGTLSVSSIVYDRIETTPRRNQHTDIETGDR